MSLAATNIAPVTVGRAKSLWNMSTESELSACYQVAKELAKTAGKVGYWAVLVKPNMICLHV